MKTRNLWRAAVLAVVVGSTLAAGVALAEGGKVRQRNGNGYGSTVRTGSTSAAAIQKAEQTRNRDRDGSCQASATQTRDRARNGSCKSR